MRRTRKEWPLKYYRGLSKTQKRKRRQEIEKFGAMDWRDPKAYVGFQTNIGRKTRRSHYTVDWQEIFPEAKSLKEKSEVTGVPHKYIKESYDRGLAAWRTGHRPGATPQQWGYARAHSYLLCGKTHYSTDSDLVRNAKRSSKKAQKWFLRCKTSKLTR